MYRGKYLHHAAIRKPRSKCHTSFEIDKSCSFLLKKFEIRDRKSEIAGPKYQICQNSSNYTIP